MLDLWSASATIAQILVAIFTGALALATMNLARETKRMAAQTTDLARETVAGTEAAERRHQEQMRPLLLIDASVIVKMERERDGGYDYDFSLEGDICNFGGGPATHVRLVVIPDTQNPKEVPLSVIGSNTRFPIKAVHWSSWSHQHREDGSAWPFQSVLGYSTVALTQKVGTTEQYSHSGLSTDLIVKSLNPTDMPRDPG